MSQDMFGLANSFLVLEYPPQNEAPQPFLNDSPVLKGVLSEKRFCTPKKKSIFSRTVKWKVL